MLKKTLSITFSQNQVDRAKFGKFVLNLFVDNKYVEPYQYSNKHVQVSFDFYFVTASSFSTRLNVIYES